MSLLHVMPSLAVCGNLIVFSGANTNNGPIKVPLHWYHTAHGMAQAPRYANVNKTLAPPCQ